MARIAGIDLPKKKRGVIGLTYIYGIGRSTARQILINNSIDENIKVQDWNDDQIGLIRESINEIKVEGQMGAGKTTFVQQVLKAMGIEELEGSPTYSLINQELQF